MVLIYNSLDRMSNREPLSTEVLVGQFFTQYMSKLDTEVREILHVAREAIRGLKDLKNTFRTIKSTVVGEGNQAFDELVTVKGYWLQIFGAYNKRIKGLEERLNIICIVLMYAQQALKVTDTTSNEINEFLKSLKSFRTSLPNNRLLQGAPTELLIDVIDKSLENFLESSAAAQRTKQERLGQLKREYVAAF